MNENLSALRAQLKQTLPNCNVIYDRESALPTRRKS